jgi:hypothetical protein
MVGYSTNKNEQGKFQGPNSMVKIPSFKFQASKFQVATNKIRNSNPNNLARCILFYARGLFFFGIWFLEFGFWNLVFGFWFLDFGIWIFLNNPTFD